MNRTIHTLSTSRTALILLLATLLTATAAQTAGAQPSGNWADYKATETLPQSDDGETIYISTAEQLALYAYNVNNDVQNSKGYYCARTVELQADIDLSAHYWTPIGNRSGFYFNGKFNGNGHVITGMNVNNDCGSNVYGFVGDFRGQSDNPSHIDNLIFRNCQVTGSVAKNVLGGVAIVAGKMSTSQSAVTNCLVLDCLVTETDKVNSYNSHGAIIGCANTFSATNNYYYNMSGEYGGGMTNYSGTTPVTADDNGARLAYAVTLPDGVTATATTGIAYDSKFYTSGGTTVTLSHEDRDDYIFNGYTSNDVTITNGTFTMPDADVTITATWTKKVLTGLISGTVTIPDGVSITLSDATITGGIVCDGSATITLVGTNSVSGASQKAGIQIGVSGTTLTIKGDGSLTANGDNQSAGIGLSRAWKPANDVIGGDIVIEGGNITANGGSQWGAGIGTGVIYYGDGSAKTARIGNITIKGGTVKATGGSEADGIGTGHTYNGCTNAIGTVTIYDGIDKVDASSIKNFGSVVYMHEETNVTDNKTDYFTITEDGARRIIMQKDDTDYNVIIDTNITGGTVTADKTTAKAGELVALTVTPASGYGLQSLTVKDASDNDVSLSNRKFIMPKGGVTVSATFIQTTAAFDEATGVLTLNGNVDADEVKAYGMVFNEWGGIDEYSPVTSVVCEPGTVLPADCSELFLYYYNSSGNLTIDLSNADVSGVTNMSRMFGGDRLTNIYVNSAWSMENVTYSDQMFYGCINLTGGNGTRWVNVRNSIINNGYDQEAADAEAGSGTYAIIDGKDGQPGYLTHKKGTPVITTAPSAKTDLVYNDEEQELITAGTTNFGNLLSYSLDGANYSADIPTATDAGTYTVYYKVEASDNWNAVDAQTVSVTIAPDNYTVTFNANGGEGTMEPMQLTRGGDWTALPANTFTRSGYGFNGWNTETDGSGTAYRDEELVKNLTTETSIVLYAQWGKDITKCTATVPDQTMGGYSYIFYKFEAANSDAELAAEMGVVVKDGDEVLTLGTDYEFGQVVYASTHEGMPEHVGDECLLEIKGKGNYAGSLWAPFTITVADAGGTWGELAWAFHAGTLTISGTGAMDAASDYSGYPWFSVASNVKTITIGEGVTTIADAAFAGTSQINYYSRVATASLPTTLTAIGDDAFAYCTGLTIAIPSGVTVSSSAFYRVGCVVGTLSDAADNADIISIMAAAQSADVTLAGRTLYKDGSWNTLCLPFDITTASGTLSGDNVQAMTLDSETSNLTGGTLTLNFTAAETIPAGTPFIIKWDESGTDITNPVFEGVTISNATNDATIEGVLTFTGTYGPVNIPADGDKTKLYLGSGNKLYYPNAAMTIGTHRAYFQLLGDLTAGEPVGTEGSGQHVRAFNLNFGDDEATGIISVHDSGFTVNGSDAWYTIDGRKLDGQPTAKGLYIHGGRKVAIK